MNQLRLLRMTNREIWRDRRFMGYIQARLSVIEQAIEALKCRPKRSNNLPKQCSLDSVDLSPEYSVKHTLEDNSIILAKQSEEVEIMDSDPETDDILNLDASPVTDWADTDPEYSIWTDNEEIDKNALEIIDPEAGPEDVLDLEASPVMTWSETDTELLDLSDNSAVRNTKPVDKVHTKHSLSNEYKNSEVSNGRTSKRKRNSGHRDRHRGQKCIWCYRWGHGWINCQYKGEYMIPCRVCPNKHHHTILRCPNFPDAPNQPRTRKKKSPCRSSRIH